MKYGKYLEGKTGTPSRLKSTKKGNMLQGGRKSLAPPLSHTVLISGFS